MKVKFELNAELRTDTGKGASRRLRHTDRVPAIMYGGRQNPTNISIVHNDLVKSLEHEAFYSHILTVNYDGKAEKAILKDLQRHPSKPRIMHLDLQRVTETDKIRIHVPLHFKGEDVAPGVKLGGGIVNHQMTNVEVVCLAKDLPEFIEADVSGLGAGESLHLSDLVLPAGVDIPVLAQGPEHDLSVVTIVMPRGLTEAEEEAAAATAAAGAEAAAGAAAPPKEGEGSPS